MKDIVQVAGVHDRREAEMLISHGVTHVGLPLGPGVRQQDLDLESASALVRTLAGRASFVLITYLTQAREIAALCRRVGVDAVQLHAELDPEQVAGLKKLMPQLVVFKSLVVGDGDVLAIAQRHEPNVDAYLTDTFDPATGARGATGMAHDWSVSRAVVQAVSRPVILAGGLHPGNVAEAVRATGALGVDAHTGLEGGDGRKDSEKVRLFVKRALAVLP